MTIDHDAPGQPASGLTAARLFTTTAAGFLFLTATAVQAQNASPPTPAATPPRVTLPGLSIEGQSTESYKTEYSDSPKFTAPLLDTPKSVTVIPEAVIQQSGSLTLTDVLRTVPGITFGSGEGGNPAGDRPFIRGFDAQTDVYVDGVRDPGSQSREMFDVERVEVIKGPSSAFTGRGSTGGAINIISKLPTLENFMAGSVTLGTDRTKRFTADVNQAIDAVGVRLNGMWHDADVAGRDDVFVHRWGFAPSITLGLGKPTRVTFSYYHMQTNDMPDYGIPYNRVRSGTTTVQTGGPAPVNRDNFYGLLNRDFRKTSSDIGTARIEHDFNENLTLRNTTRLGLTNNNYIVTNPDDSAGNVANGLLWRNTKSRNSSNHYLANQTELVGRFNTGFIRHEFLAGLEFSGEQTKNRAYVVAVGNYRYPSATPCPAVNTGPATQYNCTSLYSPNPHDPWTGSITNNQTKTVTTTNTQSAYAFDTLNFNEQWSLNLGLRFDNYETNAQTQPATATSYLSNKSNFLNYQAGLVYKPLPNGSIYLSYATSSNPSGESSGDGASNLTLTNRDLDPEENQSFELGTKWDVLNNRLSLNAAVFYMQKDNARVQLDPNTFVNAGKQKVKGFEIGAAGQITERWQVFGGYSFLDSELVNNGNYLTNANNNGKEFPNTPRHSLSLWSTYGITKDLTVGGGAFYVSKVYGNAANTLYIPSYWRFDAMAGYQVTQNVALQLNVQNVFDKRYFDKAYSTHMVSVAPGRVALLSANFKF